MNIFRSNDAIGLCVCMSSYLVEAHAVIFRNKMRFVSK